MKLRFSVLLAAASFFLPVAIYTQAAEQTNEKQEKTEQAQKELNQKASKAARKEAKALVKDGWTTAPGAIPLEKQLDRSYIMQMEVNSDLTPAYIMGEGMSIGESYDAAKVQALALAKQQIASSMESEIAAMVNSELANRQLSGDDAATISEVVQKSKSIFSQHLGRVLTVVECYRTLSNKNKEVLVRIAYSSEEAAKNAKESVYEELRSKLDKIGDNK